jgi:hypothetical protein
LGEVERGSFWLVSSYVYCFKFDCLPPRYSQTSTEPDLFRFPLYILTSAAIIEGTIDTLVSKFERDLEAKTDVPISDEEEVMIENDANLAVLNVVEDVKDLMGISKVY